MLFAFDVYFRRKNWQFNGLTEWKRKRIKEKKFPFYWRKTKVFHLTEEICLQWKSIPLSASHLFPHFFYLLLIITKFSYDHRTRVPFFLSISIDSIHLNFLFDSVTKPFISTKYMWLPSIWFGRLDFSTFRQQLFFYGFRIPLIQYWKMLI